MVEGGHVASGPQDPEPENKGGGLQFFNMLILPVGVPRLLIVGWVFGWGKRAISHIEKRPTAVVRR